MQITTREGYFYEFNQKVGAILRDERLQKNLSLSQVEEALSLSSERLQNIEQGLVSPPCNLFYSLMQFYGGHWFDVEGQLFEASHNLRENLKSLPKK